MTSGENIRPPDSLPDLNAVQAPVPPGDHYVNRPPSRRERRYEQVRAHPMELDLSFAEEGTAHLARLDEGIYRYTDVIDVFLPPDASDRDRKLFYNIAYTNDLTFPLANGTFYVKDRSGKPGMSPLERADAIVDRIAELTQGGTGHFLNDVLERIRQEGQLLAADTAERALTETIARRHPRLQLQKAKPGPDGMMVQQIEGVLAETPMLPATVGECIERLAQTYSGVAFTGTKWIKKICGRFLYTPATCQALLRAITYDSRFVITKNGDSIETTTYHLTSSKEKWPAVASRQAFLETPAFELARRILDVCETNDLQEKDNLIGKVTRGVRTIKRKKLEITETLLYDPRVFATEHPDYVQIAHTPEDAQKYEQLRDIVRTAIGNLLKYEVNEIAVSHMQDYVRGIAGSQNIPLDAHTKHLLHNLVIIDPRVSHAPQEAGMFNLSQPPDNPE